MAFPAPPRDGYPMTDDLCALSATALRAAYRDRSLSPVEVARAVLARIDRLNPLCNAFCYVDPDGALAQARESEARWRRGEPAGTLDGVPTTVKDLVLAKGWPTRRGSRTVDARGPWNEDAPPVARLREQGAVLLGKTTTPEFGWKGVTDSPVSGISRNPWDLSRTPGGSSGGAAAAAALGMGALHLATDGGGSIRIPAAFCGLFGHKPTFGPVPIYPHSPAGTLWHQGPITRTVADAALMLQAISQPDARDWRAAPPGAVDFLAGLDDGADGLRIAYSRDLGYARMDPEVATLVDAAVARLEALGAAVEPVEPPFADPLEVMVLLWSVALALAVAPLSAERRALVEAPVLDIAERGFAASALDYRRAGQAREALGARMQRFHRDFDLLVTPQLPLAAFEAGVETPPGGGMTRWWEWSPFTYPFNLTQQPAATLPCGFTDAGLPVALQAVGPRFADATVLRLCRAWEKAHPFPMPPLPTPRSGA